MTSAVSLRALRKSFGTLETIAGIDLDIEQGSFVSVIGPSGCGKSTLAASRCRARNGDFGDRTGQRRTCDRGSASQAGGDGAAAPGPSAMAKCSSQRPAAARHQQQGQRPDDQRSDRAVGTSRARLIPRCPSARAVWRHAATGRAGARPRARRAIAGDGRAPRRARRDHPVGDARPAESTRRRARSHDAVRHPLDQRGRRAQRPSAGVITASRANRCRHRDRSARPRRDDVDDDPRFFELCTQVRHALLEGARG